MKHERMMEIINDITVKSCCDYSDLKITGVYENGFTYIRYTEYVEIMGMIEDFEYDYSQAEVVTKRYK